jgi:hypothetical protein
VSSVLVYALAVPAIALAGLGATSGASLGLLAVYGVLFARVRRHRIGRGDEPADAGLYAAFCLIAKFGQLAGIARYLVNRLTRRRSVIIEYKAAREVTS